MRPTIPLLLFVSLILAGCAGSPGNPAGASPSASGGSSDPTASVTAETGGIEGTIVNDEQMPVAGVDVGLRDHDAVGKTDENGRFSFSELEPGPYEIVHEKLGYEAGAKKVDVLAGEIAKVTIVLVSVASEEPWIEPRMFRGYITAGEAFVDIVTGQLGLPGCDECNFLFTANDTVQSVVLEVLFTATVPNPTGDTTLEYQVWGATELGSGDLDAPSYAVGAWKTRDKIQFNQADYKAMWPDGEKEDFHMVHYCAALWVCVDQDFEVYLSMFHFALPEDDFTALPPP